MLKEMFLKKMADKKKLDPNEQEAKLGVIKELHKQASSALGEKSKPKAKVEVAADSKEGLALGLDKAKDIISDESSDMEGSPGEEKSESMDEAAQEKDDAMNVSEEEQQLSASELDEKIKKLIELKKSKEPKEVSKKINPFV
jgi:hypothetical protein